MKFTSIALVAAASAKTELETVNIIKVGEIVEGLVKGAIKAEKFTDLTDCVVNIEDIAADAKTVVTDFKAGGAKNIMSGLEAVADMLLWARNASI